MSRNWKSSSLPAAVFLLGFVVGAYVFPLLRSTRISPRVPGADQPRGDDDAASDRAGTASKPQSNAASARNSQGAPEEHSVAGAATPLGCIYGRVTDDAGAPVKHGSICATIADVERWESIENGSYAIVPADAGSWRLAVRADGHQEFETTVTMGSPPAVLRHDMVLARATRIQVWFESPDGGSLRDAIARDQLDFAGFGIDLEVVATHAPPKTPYYGRGFGTFLRKFERVRDGETSDGGVLTAEVPPPFHASVCTGTAVIQTQQVAPGQSEIVFVLDQRQLPQLLGEIRLRVVDGRSGTRIAKAYSDTFGGGGSRGQVADESGLIVHRCMAPGDYLITAHAFGELWNELAPRGMRVKVLPGTTVDLGNIEFKSRVTIRGKTVDSVGKALRCSVSTFRLESSDDRLRIVGVPHSGTESFADGTFELRIDEGRFVLYADSERDARHYVVVDTSHGPLEDVVLVRASGTPVQISASREYTLLVTDAAGLPHFDAIPYQEKVRIDLPPGEYLFELLEEDRLVHSARATVADTTLEIDLLTE